MDGININTLSVSNDSSRKRRENNKKNPKAKMAANDSKRSAVNNHNAMRGMGSSLLSGESAKYLNEMLEENSSSSDNYSSYTDKYNLVQNSAPDSRAKADELVSEEKFPQLV